MFGPPDINKVTLKKDTSETFKEILGIFRLGIKKSTYSNISG